MIKVNLKVIGFPLLSDALGKKKEIQIELLGNILSDLVEALNRKYGRSIKLALLDDKGQIALDIRILKNGNEYLSGDRLKASLQDGDTFYFIGAG